MSRDAEPSDHELMRRIALEDRAALGLLVRRHQDRIRALAVRFLGDPHLADDVCQDAFLRILRSARSYRPEAGFTTWVYRIVANLCWDQRRKAARAPLRLHTPPERPAGDNPGSADEQGERIEQVRAAVAALPDRQRLALLLHRYQGLSHAEIAASTGWSPAAVESCLVRAYASLRARLAGIEQP